MCVYVIKTAHISENSGNRRSLRFTDAKACKNLIFSVVVEVPYNLFAGNLPAAYVAGTFGARDFVPRRIVAFRPKPFPIFIPLEYPDFITRIQLEQFFTGNVRHRADIHCMFALRKPKVHRAIVNSKSVFGKPNIMTAGNIMAAGNCRIV